MKKIFVIICTAAFFTTSQASQTEKEDNARGEIWCITKTNVMKKCPDGKTEIVFAIDYVRHLCADPTFVTNRGRWYTEIECPRDKNTIEIINDQP